VPNPSVVGIARIVCAMEGKFSKGCEWRGAIGPWEQMQLHLHPDGSGSYAILSPDGTEWFSFDELTGGWGWRPNEPGQPGYWEKFDRDPDPARPTRIISQHDPSVDFVVMGDFPTTAPPIPVVTLPKLWIEGRDWQDDDRLYVPRWCGMLSALRPDRSVEQLEEYLTWAIGAGFTGARVFAGDLAWANQTAEGARERLPEFLDLLAAHGFACEVTAITDSASGYDWRAHLRAVMDLCRGRDGVVVEGANEIGHGTQAHDLTIEAIREVINDPAFDTLIVACGAVGTDEPDATGRYPGYGGDYCTVHLDRGRDFWNQCRRVRELYADVEAEGVPCLDNEPLGAAELDGTATGKQRSNEPPFFAVLGALDRAFQGVGGVHHNDAGLDVLIPGPVQESCAAAYVAAHRAVEGCLPGVVGGYYNAGHTHSPVGYYTDDQWAHEIIRHYSFCHGARGASVVIGLANPNLKLNWQNGWAPASATPIVEYARAGDGSKMQVWDIVQSGKRRKR
jgi:hypothetical protein